MHDLLHDPLIGVRTPAGVQRLSLPGLLAALSAGQVDGYTGLRAHQADPWHVFLVQLAASIQARRPTDALPTDATYWREGLLDLADGIPEAWQLVVEDVTKPAFMQHPYCPKASYKPCAYAPDELDVLFTSKSHDVKPAKVAPDDMEAWLYALMTRQTISPYGGGGGALNGVARMNSGYGSRPFVAWVRDLHTSKRFQDETNALCRLRGSIVNAPYGYSSDRAVVLTWTHPWNSQGHQFFLRQLEPWFIESARLIRLKRDEYQKGIFALQAGTKARQIGPKEPHKGDIGDPWIPITTEGAALTITSPGFTPARLCKLIFKDGISESKGLLMTSHLSDSNSWLVASVLTGGNCQTDGFYHIELPVPAKIKRSLSQETTRKTLAHLAQHLLNDAKDVQECLRIAFYVLAVEAAENELRKKQHTTTFAALNAIQELSRKKEKKKAFERIDLFSRETISALTRTWEQHYFPTLWRGADEDHETVRRNWQQRLVEAGQALLDEAATRLPLPTNRRWRALTQAESAWRGMLHKAGLPLPGRATTEPAETEEQTA
ncbi:hypothetical protein [Silanimonas lenta]|uniref:hypothetical protein n=1 Tax=Silanimonas lenta TaxID=265429 RepID=UPI00040BF294|nr:hypothetical protein [Silanimonas lenta]